MLNQLNGCTALVTGAGGFIGRHLCQRLCHHDVEVYGISRKHQDTANGMLHWLQGDVARLPTVKRFIARVKPDLIFHLASLNTGSRDPAAVRPTVNNNLLTTINLLETATETGCRRIVLAGSLEEPGKDCPTVVPASPYAVAKWASSAYGRMYHALFQTPVVIARIFMAYGPHQYDLRKLVPYVALSLLRGEAPQLTSGSRPVDWIYVEDVADGLLALAVAEGIDGQTIDLGSGTLITVRDFVEQLSELIPSSVEPQFAAIPDRPLERVAVANVENTMMKTGWRATTAPHDGMRATLQWCREMIESPVSVG